MDLIDQNATLMQLKKSVESYVTRESSYEIISPRLIWRVCPALHLAKYVK